MGKLVKLLATLIGGLILIVVAAVIVIPLVVDPNDFKKEITDQVKEMTGRELSIGGDLGLSVFPWLGLELNDLELSNAPGFGEQPFAAVSYAQVRAKLLPLLRQTLEVDTLRVEGLRLNLAKDRDGRGNWEDLAGPVAAETEQAPSQAEPDTAAPGLTGLSIGGIRVADAGVVWDDRQTNQRYQVGELGLETGAIRPGQPVDLSLAFRLVSEQPEASAWIAIKGEVATDQALRKFDVTPLTLQVKELQAQGIGGELKLRSQVAADLDAQRYRLDELELKANLTGEGLPEEGVSAQLLAALAVDLARQRLNSKNLRLRLQAQQLPAQGVGGELELQSQLAADLAAQRYQLDGLQMDVRLNGEGLPKQGVSAQLLAELAVDLAKQRLGIDNLALTSGELTVSGRLEGQKIQTQPQFSGALQVTEFNPRRLLQQWAVEIPETADPKVLQRLSLATTVKSTPQQVALEGLKIRLDDTQMQGKLRLEPPDKPGIRFDLTVDAIDLDRYLPPQALADAEKPQPAGDGEAQRQQAAGGDLFPVEALRQLDVAGEFRLGRMVIKQLIAEDVRLTLKAKDGRIQLDESVETFYQGAIKGSVGIDVSAEMPVVRVDQHLERIQAGPLLKDLTGDDTLSGQGRFNATLNTRGQSQAALTQNLNGKLDFRFTDGTVKGFNLISMIKRAKAAIKGKPLPDEGAVDQTDFSELGGSAIVTDGVLVNKDLHAKSPLLRLDGAGEVDLAAERLDYTATPTIVGSLEGQGGRELEDLVGVPIPIKLSGSFVKPKYSIDLKQVLVAAQKTRLKEKVEKLETKLDKKVDKKLEGVVPDDVKEQLKDSLKGLKGLF